jgi:hypothetical protein
MRSSYEYIVGLGLLSQPSEAGTSSSSGAVYN